MKSEDGVAEAVDGVPYKSPTMPAHFKLALPADISYNADRYCVSESWLLA